MSPKLIKKERDTNRFHTDECEDKTSCRDAGSGAAGRTRDPTSNVEIFSTEDERIKSFGEMLTNDSSREVLQILMKEEQTALELSQRTGLSLPLVIYHLNKMQNLDVIKVSKVGTNVKGQDMKYYRATKFAIVILPSTVTEKARQSRSLMRSFRMIHRFVGTGIAGIAAWFGSMSMQGPAPPPGPDFSEDAPPVPPGARYLGDSASELPMSGAWESGSGEHTDDVVAAGSKVATETESESAPQVPGAEPQLAPGGLPSDEGARPGGASQIGGEVADSGGPLGILPEDLILPAAVTAAVVGTGLLLELIYRMRRIRKEKARQARR